MRYNKATGKFKRNIFVRGSDLISFELGIFPENVDYWNKRLLIHIISVERKD